MISFPGRRLGSTSSSAWVSVIVWTSHWILLSFDSRNWSCKMSAFSTMAMESCDGQRQGSTLLVGLPSRSHEVSRDIMKSVELKSIRLLCVRTRLSPGVVKSEDTGLGAAGPTSKLHGRSKRKQGKRVKAETWNRQPTHGSRCAVYKLAVVTLSIRSCHTSGLHEVTWPKIAECTCWHFRSPVLLFRVHQICCSLVSTR